MSSDKIEFKIVIEDSNADNIKKEIETKLLDFVKDLVLKLIPVVAPPPPPSSSGGTSNDDTGSGDSGGSSSSSGSCENDIMKLLNNRGKCEFSPHGIEINDGTSSDWKCPEGTRMSNDGSDNCIRNIERNKFISPSDSCGSTNDKIFNGKQVSEIISDLDTKFSSATENTNDILFDRIRRNNDSTSRIIRSQFMKQICGHTSSNPSKNVYKCNKNEDGSDCTAPDCWTIGEDKPGEEKSLDCTTCRKHNNDLNYTNINNKKILKKDKLGNFKCDYNKCNYIQYAVSKSENFVKLGSLKKIPNGEDNEPNILSDEKPFNSTSYKPNEKIFHCSRDNCNQNKFFTMKDGKCYCLNYDTTDVTGVNKLKKLNELNDCTAAGSDCYDIYTTEVNIDGIGCIHELDRSSFYFDKKHNHDPNQAIQWLSDNKEGMCDGNSRFECREDQAAIDKCNSLNDDGETRWVFDNQTKKCKCNISGSEKIKINGIELCEKPRKCEKVENNKFPLSTEYYDLDREDKQLFNRISGGDGACGFDMDMLCNGADYNEKWKLNEFLEAIRHDYNFKGSDFEKSGETPSPSSGRWTTWGEGSSNQSFDKFKTDNNMIKFPFNLSYRTGDKKNWIHLCKCGVETNNDVIKEHNSKLNADSDDYLVAWQYGNPFTNCHCSYGHYLEPSSTETGTNDIIIPRNLLSQGNSGVNNKPGFKTPSQLEDGDKVYFNYKKDDLFTRAKQYSMIKGVYKGKTGSNARVEVGQKTLSIPLNELNYIVDQPIEQTKNAKCTVIQNDACSTQLDSYNSGKFLNYTKPNCSVRYDNTKNCCDDCSKKKMEVTSSIDEGGYETYDGKMNKLPIRSEMNIQKFEFSRNCSGSNNSIHCIQDNHIHCLGLGSEVGCREVTKTKTMNPLFATKNEFLDGNGYQGGSNLACGNVKNKNYCNLKKRQNILINYGSINENETKLGNYQGSSKGYNSRKLNWRYEPNSDTSKSYKFSETELGTNDTKKKRRIFNPYGGLKTQKKTIVTPAWNAGGSTKSPSVRFGKILTYETENGFKTNTERVRQNIFFCRKTDSNKSDPIQNTGARKPGGLLTKQNLASQNTTNFPSSDTKPQIDERYFEIHNINEKQNVQSNYLYDWNVAAGTSGYHFIPGEYERWRVRSTNRANRYAWNQSGNQTCNFDDGVGQHSTTSGSEARNWTIKANQKNALCGQLKYRVPAGSTEAELRSGTTSSVVKGCRKRHPRGVVRKTYGGWDPRQDYTDFKGCLF